MLSDEQVARFHRFLNLDLSHHLVPPLKNSGDVLTELGKKFYASSRDKSLYERLKGEDSVEERGDPLRRRIFPTFFRIFVRKHLYHGFTVKVWMWMLIADNDE